MSQEVIEEKATTHWIARHSHAVPGLPLRQVLPPALCLRHPTAEQKGGRSYACGTGDPHRKNCLTSFLVSGHGPMFCPSEGTHAPVLQILYLLPSKCTLLRIVCELCMSQGLQDRATHCTCFVQVSLWMMTSPN